MYRLNGLKFRTLAFAVTAVLLTVLAVAGNNVVSAAVVAGPVAASTGQADSAARFHVVAKPLSPNTNPLVAQSSTVKNITIILSGTETVYQRTQTAFMEALPPEIQVVSTIYDQWEPDNASLVVAIGAAATRRVIDEDPKGHFLSILLPSNTFRQLATNNSNCSRQIASGRLSAIYMDQPAYRQLNLARIVAPDLRTVGTLYDNLSRSLVEELGRTARSRGLQFQSRELLDSDNPVAVLREMYADIDLFLAVPGRYIFNRSTAKWMLYQSYRHRKPLIGFSNDYVQAGAVAAVYSEPEDIAREAAEIVSAWFEGAQLLPVPKFPKYYSVTINRQVSSRLGISLPASSQVVEQLRELEKMP